MQVCQFNNVSCGTFQAVTQTGYLTVLCQNVGAIAADYQLQVTFSSPITDEGDSSCAAPRHQSRKALWGGIASQCLLLPILETEILKVQCLPSPRNTHAKSGNKQVPVQVANCSETVSPILAQSLALVARQSLSSTFQVYVQSPLASNLSCLVTLLDSQVAAHIATVASGCSVPCSDRWVVVSISNLRTLSREANRQNISAHRLVGEKVGHGSHPG